MGRPATERAVAETGSGPAHSTSGRLSIGGAGLAAGADSSMRDPSVPSQLLSIVSSFTGTVFDQYYPPDVQVAAGPTSVVEIVNSLVTVYSKQGLLTSSVTLQSFLNVSYFDGVYDSRIVYDNSSQRWFLSSEDFSSAYIFIAASKTNDPSAGWWVYRFGATNACPDQPTLGVSDDKVAVSVNDYSNCYSSLIGVQYWIFNKSQIMTGAAKVDNQTFGPDPTLLSVHPAQNLSPSKTLYMITDYFSQAGSVRLYNVTGLPEKTLTVKTIDFPISTVFVPPSALQLGSNFPLDTGDGRVLDAKWDNGTLWVSLNDACTPTGDTQFRSCVRMIQINTQTKQVIQDFNYGSAGQYYLYGAMSPDGLGNLLVILGDSSSTSYPGLMVTAQRPGDPLDTLEKPLVLSSGTGPDVTHCSFQLCRYGDYFEAAQDPSNPAIVWVAGQYGTTYGTWATTIGELTLSVSFGHFSTGMSFGRVDITLSGNMTDLGGVRLEVSTSLNAANSITKASIYSKTASLNATYAFGTAQYVEDIPTNPYWMGVSCEVKLNLATNCFTTRTPDIAHGGSVTIVDVSMVVSQYGEAVGSQSYNPTADLTGRGQVDIVDVGIVIHYYGATVITP